MDNRFYWQAACFLKNDKLNTFKLFRSLQPDMFLYGLGSVVVLPLTLLVLAADNIRPSAVAPQTISLCIGALWSIFCVATGLWTSVCYFLVSTGLPLAGKLLPFI